MSAAGRLWQRAPAWRLFLVCAIATTALAAMFPPPVPHWAATKPDGTEIAPSFVPQAASDVPDYGIIESPPPGPGRSGIIPFSGRQVPLPAGNWQQLVLGRGKGPMAAQVSMLGRVEAQRLTGLLLALSPGPLGNAAGTAPDVAPCNLREAVAHQTVPADPFRDPLSQECWSLVPLDMEAADSPAKTNPTLGRGLARLAEMGIAIPSHMLVLIYIRSDPTGWLTLQLLLPDPSGASAAASRRLQTWVRRFAPLLHKGFDGTLNPSDLTPALSRDPQDD